MTNKDSNEIANRYSWPQTDEEWFEEWKAEFKRLKDEKILTKKEIAGVQAAIDAKDMKKLEKLISKYWKRSPLIY